MNEATDPLVDTNIFVYVYDPRDTAKQERAILVVDTLTKASRGAVSTQVLGEFFNATTRKLPARLTAAEAADAVAVIARHWIVLDGTLAIVREAMAGVQRYQLPYWDALIWATAKLNGLTTVLSEDFSDGSRLDGVSFVNPFRADFDITRL